MSSWCIHFSCSAQFRPKPSKSSYTEIRMDIIISVVNKKKGRREEERRERRTDIILLSIIKGR